MQVKKPFSYSLVHTNARLNVDLTKKKKKGRTLGLENKKQVLSASYSERRKSVQLPGSKAQMRIDF